MDEQIVKLTIRQEGQPDHVVDLPPGIVRVGRAADNELVLPQDRVSRRHARLDVREDVVVVEDGGSANGTWYREERVQRQKLRDGDAITIGSFTLVFSIPRAPKREVTEPVQPFLLLDPMPSPLAQPAAAPQPMVAPAPNPAPTAIPAPMPAPGGFGVPELQLRSSAGPGRTRFRKMSLSAGPRAGGFMRNHIGKLTAGIAIAAMLVVAIKFVGNTMVDGPTLGPRDRDPEAPPPPTVIAGKGQASQETIDAMLGEANAHFAGRRYLDAARGYAAVHQLNPANATATKMGYHATEFMVVQAMFDTVSERAQQRSERQASREAALALASDALAGEGQLTAARRAVAAELEQTPEDQELLALRDELEGKRRTGIRDAHARGKRAHEREVAALYEKAQATLSRGDDMAAYAEFAAVLAADSEKETEWYWKAEDLQRRIRSDRAELGKESYRAGVAAKRSGDFLVARAKLQQALRDDPFHASARRHLDEVQSKLDQQALQLWSRAEVYEKTNQVELAVGEYQKVLNYSAASSSPLARKAQARIDALLQ